MPSYSYNKVILIGNITRDLELRYIASGTAVVKVGLAVTEKFKSSEGEKKEKTCFVDCTFWGRQAETLCEYSGKGRCILVEGSLELDSWTDKDGNKRSQHRVRGDRFVFLDYGTGQGQGAPGARPQGQGQAQGQAKPAPRPAPSPAGASEGPPDDEPPFPPEAPPDDIPF